MRLSIKLVDAGAISLRLKIELCDWLMEKFWLL